MSSISNQPALPGMSDAIGTPAGTPHGTPTGTPAGTPPLRLQTQTPFDMAPTITLPGEHPAHRPAEIDARTGQRVALRTRRYWLWLPEDTDPGTIEALEAWQALAQVCGERLNVRIRNRQTGATHESQELATFNPAQLPEGYDYRIQIQTATGEWGPVVNVSRRTSAMQPGMSAFQTQQTPLMDMMRMARDAEERAEARMIRLIEIMRPTSQPAGNMAELLHGLKALDEMRGTRDAKPANPLDAIASTIEAAKKLGMTNKAGTAPGPTTAETIRDMLPGVTAALATIAKAFRPADQPGTVPPQHAEQHHTQQAAAHPHTEIIDQPPAHARPVAATVRPTPPPRPAAAASPAPRPVTYIGNELNNRRIDDAQPDPAQSPRAVAVRRWRERITAALAKADMAGKLTPAMLDMLAEIAAAQDTPETEMQTASRIYARHILALSAEELAPLGEFIAQTQDIGGAVIIAGMCGELERDSAHFLEVCACVQAIAFPEQIKDEEPDAEPDTPAQTQQPGTETKGGPQ